MLVFATVYDPTVSTITVPTAPLTAIANTQLLICQSPTFIDNSTNNFTITAVGNSRPTQQNPFGYTSALTEGYTVSTIGGSAYFDGTGDYLSVPDNSALTFGSGNFTISGWLYPTATGPTNNATVLSKVNNIANFAPYSISIGNGNSNLLFYYFF